MTLLSSITNVVAFVVAHKFAAMVILFGAMVIEGETFLIVAGVLVHLGALSFWEVITIAIFGVIVGDLMWYFIGFYMRKIKRAERIINSLESIVERLLPQFKEKPFVSLVLAKYVYGTNHATLILSGVIGMNLWLFAKAEFVASVIWILVFVTLGYIFGSAALLISNRLSIFLLVVLIFIASFIAIQRAIFRYYEKRRLETEQPTDIPTH